MKISVAMCTYNGERFLNEQLDSILAQNFPVNEIIICDDKSTDNTVEILENYKNKHPEIVKIFNNSETLRSIKNFEKAISLCTGDVIFLADQDDYWRSDKVKVIIDYFNKNPQVSTVSTNGHVIDDESVKIKDSFIIWDVFAKFRAESPNFSLFNFLSFKTNFATGATMAFRKSQVPFILPIPEIHEFHHDEYIALIAASQNSMEFINEKLINYRIHESQQVGGIAFTSDKSIFNETLSHYKWDSDTSKNDFQTLKTRIKSQIKWHNHYIPFYRDQIKNSSAFELIKKAFFNELNRNLNTMKKLYPLKYSLLMFTDKISGKRKLKK